MTDVSTILMLGAAETAPSLPNSAMSPSARQAMGGVSAVFVAVFAVVGLCLLWAVFIRKPGNRRQNGTLQESSSSSGSSGRRRRKSKERPRNPTLSETGGLPPRGAGEINDPRK
jgi:hypothetical protein